MRVCAYRAAHAERYLDNDESVLAVKQAWKQHTGRCALLMKRSRVVTLLRDLRANAAVVPPNKFAKLGFLHKEGGSVKNWRRRYFVMTQERMSYYKGQEVRAQARTCGGLRSGVPLWQRAVLTMRPVARRARSWASSSCRVRWPMW